MNNEHINDYNYNLELFKKAFVEQIIEEVENCAEKNNEHTSLPADSASELSRAEKNHLLYLRQKALLRLFLEKGAISKEQYEKSLHDMTEKMGES